MHENFDLENYAKSMEFNYCLFQRIWRSGLRLNSKACGGPIFLKFLPGNRASICVNFWWLENFFRPPAFFLRAAKRKNEAVFRNFFEVVNFNEIFYVTKVIKKIQLDAFVIGRIVNFYFHQILEFSD